MRLFNKTRMESLGPVRLADSFLKRLIGMWMDHPDRDSKALWLKPCNSIHTLGMRWPLDVVFLDRSGRVVKIQEGVRPYRFGPFCGKAHSVVEWYHGKWDMNRIQPGDELEVIEE